MGCIVIKSPLYIVSKTIDCWNCEAAVKVVGLMSKDILDESVTEDKNTIFNLSYITNLPKSLVYYINKLFPGFKLKYSKTMDVEYYANTCLKCRSIFGDFFLHGEPGAVFVPMDEKEAAGFDVLVLSYSDPIKAESSWYICTGDLILSSGMQENDTIVME